MAVGRSAPRFQTLALLYPKSKTLQSQLSEYSIVVVHLCQQILRFAGKSAIGQFASTITDFDIKKYQDDLSSLANSIKEEVSVLMAISVEDEALKNSRFRAMAFKQSELALHQQTLRTRIDVLDSCSKYDHKTVWKQTRKIGNSTLFNLANEYKDWKRGTYSKTLIYLGKLGSGKSVLLANVVDDIHLSTQDENTVVAYFFCRYDIPESLIARTVIGSLTRQLLHAVPNLSHAGELLGSIDSIPDSEQMFLFLRKSLPLNFKAYFVLDGLNECDQTERQLIFQYLRKLQESFTILLCTSVRVEPRNIRRPSLKNFAAASSISIPDQNPDIEAYIEAELTRCLDTRDLVLGSALLICEIRDALWNECQGMFLWVALQIKSLCTMKTDSAIRQALADLPPDLPTTFSRILRRSEKLGKAYQNPILELIAVARRPLTSRELQEALGVIPGITTLNPANIPNDIHSTLSCCGSLVIIDEEELTVRFVHRSVKQFLVSDFRDFTDKACTIESMQTRMTSIIVTYLNYGVFETQLSKVVVPQISAESMPNRIISSTLNSPNSVRQHALKLLKSGKRSACDIGKTLAAVQPPRSFSVDMFHFHAYAKSCWVHHLRCTRQPDMRILELLLNLLRGNMSCLPLQHDDGLALLRWAALNGHETIFQALLNFGRVEVDVTKEDITAIKQLLCTGKVDVGSRDVVSSLYDQDAQLLPAAKGYQTLIQKSMTIKYEDLNAKQEQGLAPLAWAALSGYEMVVRFLLTVDRVDINITGFSGETPLHLAIERGHAAIIRLLLSQEESDVNKTDQTGQTPLHRAVLLCHARDVELLLAREEIDANLRDMSGRTPLTIALKCGQMELLDLLLASGKVELTLNDLEGRTPLSWAALQGNTTAVACLLSNCMEGVNLKDKHGWTALAHAASQGHTAVVDLLLATGNVDVNSRDMSGETALARAASQGHTKVVDILLAVENIDVNSRDEYGYTVLARAASNGHTNVIDLLLAFGNIDINSRDRRGYTALSRAASQGHAAVVKLLLTHRNINVGINSRDENGCTALELAKGKHSFLIADFLLATHKVDTMSKEAAERIASHKGYSDIISLLEEYTTDIADDSC